MGSYVCVDADGARPHDHDVCEDWNTSQAWREERLADLLTGESSSDRPSSEVLRVLVHPVIEHQQAQLKDDASTLYVSG